MDRNYVVILQAVKLGKVTDRIELAEFARVTNALIFMKHKANDMWNYSVPEPKKAKSPSFGVVYYHDDEQFRQELFVQPRLVTVEEFSRANAPQT